MPLSALVLAALVGSSEPSLVAPPGPSFGLDRLDLISEDPGVWLHYELPMVGVYPVTPLLRFVEQLKPVFTLPVANLYAGVSITSQSLTYERAIFAEHGLFWTLGLQTRLLFPRGALAGLAYRTGRFRFGLSLSAFTDGSWSRPQATALVVVPTVGFGIGGRYQP